MIKTIVGVLRGGDALGYDFSLKTGDAILRALPEDRYIARDVFIDKAGLWHMGGRALPPRRILDTVDVVFNALHGGMGEDGTVARIVERAGRKLAGPSARAQTRSLNKLLSRQALCDAGVRMPRAVGFALSGDITTLDMARAVFEQFGPPYVVKPPARAFSEGVVYVKVFSDLSDAIGDVLDAYGSAVVEEFVVGDEVTVGVINGYRDRDVYILPPAQVVSSDEGRGITPRAWREGLLQTVCPLSSASLRAHTDAILESAQRAHTALDLDGYASMDFIVTKRGPYLLEIDALPPLYDGAPFPEMLSAVGSSVSEFVEHTIATAKN